MDIFGNRKHVIMIAIGLIVLQFVGLLIYYDSAHIEVHDNLDSVFVWLKLLKDNELFFAIGNETLPFLGGISRHYLPSELQLGNLLYYFFEPLDAYLIVYFSKVLLGIGSFWLLSNYILNKYLVNAKEFSSCIFLVAVAFSILPGYANLYFAQASVPLVFYLFLRAINEKKLWLFTSLFIYPVLSELPRYGMFILAAMGLFFIYSVIKKDGRYKYIFLAMLILSMGYIITEYHFFISYLISDSESIRKVMVASDESIFRIFKQGFLKGQYHAQSMHYIVILPALSYVLISVYRKKIATFGLKNLLLYLLAGIIVNVFIFSLSDSTAVRELVGLISPLKGWNYGRTIWFNPLLWHLLFVVCLIVFVKNNRVKTANILALLQIIVILVKPSYYNDFAKTLRCEIKQCENSLSYKDFFSEDAFGTIKTKMKYNGEPVLAFGMHPSILTFNGFNTLDGYHNGYSIDYKDKFRTIIAPALNESEKYKAYFDDWGGRAYLFSPNMNGKRHLYKPYNRYNDALVDLLINTDAASELGAKYIISLYELNTEKAPGLYKVFDFKNETSPYHIRVYQIKNRGNDV